MCFITYIPPSFLLENAWRNANIDSVHHLTTLFIKMNKCVVKFFNLENS